MERKTGKLTMKKQLNYADNGKGTKFDNTIPRPEILLTEVWLGTRKK